MKVKSKVHFFFQSKMRLTDRTRIKTFLTILFKKEKKIMKCLTYVFCSDEYLLKINQTFLKHNYYTDVLTFDLSETSKIIEGEIYISIDRVRENSKELKINVSLEFLRVILHGALHLCGYTDKTKLQKKEMEKKEDEYLYYYLMFHMKH